MLDVGAMFKCEQHVYASENVHIKVSDVDECIKVVVEVNIWRMVVLQQYGIGLRESGWLGFFWARPASLRSRPRSTSVL